MYDLRRLLFYSYMVYLLFLPGIFLVLLLVHNVLGTHLIPVMIFDTILFIALIVNLYCVRNGRRRGWFYVWLSASTTFLTLRNACVMLYIIRRTLTDFKMQRAIFSDAIDRRVGVSFASGGTLMALFVSSIDSLHR